MEKEIKDEVKREGWKSDAKPLPEPIAIDSSEIDMSKLQIKKGKKE